jgi:hypothetical protein
VHSRYNIFVGKPKVRNHLVGRPTRRWEDNIKIYSKDIEWKVWTYSSGSFWDQWRAYVNTVMDLRILHGVPRSSAPTY